MQDFYDIFTNVQCKRVIHEKDVFLKRYKNFTKGLFTDFDFTNAVLSGGSLFSLLDKSISDDEILHDNTADLDMFLIRNDDFLKKLTYIVNFFENYAKKRNLNIVFVARGLLVEILIENCRRIQLLCTCYKSVEKCILSLDFVHVHMYFDGKTILASKDAMKHIRKRETRLVGVPIKKPRVEKLSQKNIKLVNSPVVTEMDLNFFDTLTILDNFKEKVNQNQEITDFYDFHVYFTTHDLIIFIKNLSNSKWKSERALFLKKVKTNYDIDIFDLFIRLPLSENIIDNLLLKKTDHTNTRVIKLGLDNFKKSCPALFVERKLQVLLFYYCKNGLYLKYHENENLHNLTENFKTLSKVSKQKVKLVFRKDTSQFFKKGQLLNIENHFPYGQKCVCTFLVTIANNTIIFNIIELSTT